MEQLDRALERRVWDRVNGVDRETDLRSLISDAASLARRFENLARNGRGRKAQLLWGVFRRERENLAVLNELLRMEHR